MVLVSVCGPWFGIYNRVSALACLCCFRGLFLNLNIDLNLYCPFRFMFLQHVSHRDLNKKVLLTLYK